ncbi:peroxiredoxin [Silvimonas amylolytica]|uniref:thioredoxin-dependent peroxiredoxin n=1 Tax=Silvimonas amylolytica TaxID=449663 RepID=A0ABQ2PMT7_9NEIS|nr:peroxiredoxin [Silvimonas amylolytica]GGP26598.1 peroxiredoxin [Silvimonas amylolytica]
MKQLKQHLALITAAILLPTLSFAALPNGTTAPDFTTQASLGGKVYNYNLADALKKGPVVLYFYPAAFTTGCTIEAHDFADAVDQYKSLGATVIGVSADKIETLNKFSVSECRSKFPVASDADQKIMKSYDAVLALKTSYADRVSYVITPDGKIIYSYQAMNPDKHVANTIKALQDWKAGKPVNVEN